MNASCPLRSRLHGAALALGLAFAVQPSRAVADPLPVALSLRDGVVVARVDLSAALPADLAARLGNGLRNVVAVYVAVVPVGDDRPTAASVRVFDVLFDVWEETWTVIVRDAASPAGRRSVVGGADELAGLLAHGADGPLTPLGALPSTPFTVDVRIDLNPVSPELLARTREYLAGAAGRPGGASRSVLGAVAGFLLREPEDDASLFFRSRPLSSAAVQPR